MTNEQAWGLKAFLRACTQEYAVEAAKKHAMRFVNLGFMLKPYAGLSRRYQSPYEVILSNGTHLISPSSTPEEFDRFIADVPEGDVQRCLEIAGETLDVENDTITFRGDKYMSRLYKEGLLDGAR